MLEQLSHILADVSLVHLNILVLLGLVVFGGTFGGRLFQRLRIPQVVGYIVIGVIIGETGLKIIHRDIIEVLQPFNYFALGLIGFLVGGELKKSVFVKYGKQLITVLLSEGIAPFLLVTVLVGSIGTLLLGDWRMAWALAVLLGAISSATDPATTTAVFKEYKTKGPLTTIILSIVALDDGLALLLFAVASSIAEVLSGNAHGSLSGGLLRFSYEIGGSIIIGSLVGLILCQIIKRYFEKERILTYSIGAILLVTGLSLALHLELILAAMTAGVVLANSVPRKSKALFDIVGGFTPPIYVLFFVLIGAKLHLGHLTPIMALFVGIYLFGTMAGKMIGSYFGASISGAPKSVRRFLPFGLFSQAGIAIGLSILAAQYFPGEIGNTLVIIITATTFALQLIGPPFTKFAVTKAGEVGLSITEEDLEQTNTVKDFMDKSPLLIYKNTRLSDILNIFSESDHLYYPVVDKENRLVGIISIDSIKNVFGESSLNDFILADDLVEPVIAKVSPETSLSEVKRILGANGLEYLPVVEGNDRVVGSIERRLLERAISTKLMGLQKQADYLDKAV